MPKNTTVRLTEELEAKLGLVSKVMGQSEAELTRAFIDRGCDALMAKPSFKGRAQRILEKEQANMRAIIDALNAPKPAKGKPAPVEDLDDEDDDEDEDDE